MKTRICPVLLMVVLGVVGLLPNVSAQDENNNERQQQKDSQEQQQSKPEKPNAQQHADKTNRPVSAYRLDFTVSELEDGKKTNSRDYSLIARTGSWDKENKLWIGTRLPVATGGDVTSPKGFQYVDLGMNIDCVVQEQEGVLLLYSRVDMSSMAAQRDEQLHQPIIRQMRSEVSSVLSPGKPTVITSMDDLSAKTRFQLEVTATKVK